MISFSPHLCPDSRPNIRFRTPWHRIQMFMTLYDHINNQAKDGFLGVKYYFPPLHASVIQFLLRSVLQFCFSSLSLLYLTIAGTIAFNSNRFFSSFKINIEIPSKLTSQPTYTPTHLPPHRKRRSFEMGSGTVRHSESTIFAKLVNLLFAPFSFSRSLRQVFLSLPSLFYHLVYTVIGQVVPRLRT